MSKVVSDARWNGAALCCELVRDRRHSLFFVGDFLRLKMYNANKQAVQVDMLVLDPLGKDAYFCLWCTGKTRAIDLRSTEVLGAEKVDYPPNGPATKDVHQFADEDIKKLGLHSVRYYMTRDRAQWEKALKEVHGEQRGVAPVEGRENLTWRVFDLPQRCLRDPITLSAGSCCHSGLALIPSERGVTLATCLTIDQLGLKGGNAKTGEYIGPDLGGNLGMASTAEIKDVYRKLRVSDQLGMSDGDRKERVNRTIRDVGCRSKWFAECFSQLGLTHNALDDDTTVDAFLRKFRKKMGLPDEFYSVEDTAETRTLPLILDGGDKKRKRNFKDAVGLMKEEPHLDWPVSGPRSAASILCIICDHYDGSPIARSREMRGPGRLDTSDPGVDVHAMLMEVIYDAVCYDQLNICDLVSFERLFRWIHMFEWTHREKLGVIAGSRADQLQKFGACGSMGNTLLICPLLEAQHNKNLLESYKVEDALRKQQELNTRATSAEHNRPGQQGRKLH